MGYRDIICSQIGMEVEEVTVGNEALIVGFINSVALIVSLRDEDHVGPEAAQYIGVDGTIVIF